MYADPRLSYRFCYLANMLVGGYMKYNNCDWVEIIADDSWSKVEETVIESKDWYCVEIDKTGLIVEKTYERK